MRVASVPGGPRPDEPAIAPVPTARCPSPSRFSEVDARGRDLRGEPGPGRSPVAQDGGFGNLEQLRRLRDVETAEVAAFDQQRLTRMDAGEIVERGVECEQLAAG